MVVGTAERHIQIFDLNNPTTAYKVGVLASWPFLKVRMLTVWFG
jgi:hypothetical protein